MGATGGSSTSVFPRWQSTIDNRKSTMGFVTDSPANPYVSRGGDKLDAALQHFAIDVTGIVCADLGSHVGGFVDCLLRRGARRVYSIDTAYGILAWKLRKDPRVTVLERTNALHAILPGPVDLVTVDVGWTPQRRILQSVTRMISPVGRVVTLIKPHYEAPKDLLESGVLPDAAVDSVVEPLLSEIQSQGWKVEGVFPSPLRGHGGNREVFALLTRSQL